VALRLNHAASPLNDASVRGRGEPGLTDYDLALGGEGEVGALFIGTYWLQRSLTR